MLLVDSLCLPSGTYQDEENCFGVKVRVGFFACGSLDVSASHFVTLKHASRRQQAYKIGCTSTDGLGGSGVQIWGLI